MKQMFDEMAAEVGSLRSLLSAIPEENVIDRASLESRIRVVIEKAIQNAAVKATKAITTPPFGFSNESEECGLWWHIDAERAVEELVNIVEFADANRVVKL